MEEIWAWASDAWSATGGFRTFLWDERGWLFSGIGASAVTGVVALISRRKRAVAVLDFDPQELPEDPDLPTKQAEQQLMEFLSTGSRPTPSAPKFDLLKPTDAERLLHDKNYQELLRNIPRPNAGVCLDSSRPDPLASFDDRRRRSPSLVLLIAIFVGSFLVIGLAMFGFGRP